MASEVKWIKIVTDIFDDEKILIIESMPEADAIIVIWFKLLCLAGKQNNSGVFVINGRIPYTDEMFATIFRRPLNTVRLALAAFEKYGMVEIINGTVTIPNWEKHQSLDALEASRAATRNRVAKHREKQRLLASGGNGSNVTDGVTPPEGVTHCNGNRVAVDGEEDLDIAEESSVSEGQSDDCPPHEPEKKPGKKKPEKKIPEEKKTSNEPAVISLPLNDGTFYEVTQSEIDQYASLYPAVDIMQQYRNMLGWLNTHPMNRKTRSGIGRFINSWLSKEQNSGNAYRNGYQPAKRSGYTPTPAPIQDDECEGNPFKR